MPRLPARSPMIFSSPANAPATMNSTFVVSNLDELLVRVLAPTLRRYRGGSALEDLQQRLLHALAGDVLVIEGFSDLRAILVDLVDVEIPVSARFTS